MLGQGRLFIIVNVYQIIALKALLAGNLAAAFSRACEYSNNMYIEAVSQTFLKSLRVTCDYSNNMVPVLFNKKKPPFREAFLKIYI